MFGILEEVASWAIGAGCDWGKDTIKAAVEGHALAASQESYETKMYQAIINSLNEISYHRYQGKDRIYEAAEVFVKDWAKKGYLNLEVPQKGLRLILDEVSISDCKEFIKVLYDEISKVEELRNRFVVQTTGDIRTKANDILKQGETLKEEIDNLSKKQDENTKEIIHKIALQAPEQVRAYSNKFANNKKQEYIKKWKSKLFLHEEETDQRYTLERAFIMPDYWKKNDDGDEWRPDLESFLSEFIETQSSIKNTLLILGVPGMGKTSLVSYLANEYSNNQNLIILRFADFKELDFEQGLAEAVYRKLNCSIENLADKILILEGFDEIRYSGDRDNLIKDFLLDIKGLHSFKLLVTSRGNYINHNVGFKNVIALSHFDADKIKIFGYEIFNIDVQDKIYKNEEVLGIPVILYMALTVGVDIYEKSSKSELYEKIFALEGGIFDRFSIKGTDGYMSGAHPLEYKKEDFHSILQLLAFKIFDENWDGKRISKDAYEKVIESYISGCYGVEGKVLYEKRLKELKDITFDFPIKNLFDNAAGLVEFIHRSIYEYFVAEYIYTEIKQRFQSGNKIDLAKCLSRLLKGDFLSEEIIEFLSFKFKNNKVMLGSYNIFKSGFDLMMRAGMTYYLEEKVIQILFAESKVLYNLLEIIYFWSNKKEFNVNIKDEKYFAALLTSVKQVFPGRVEMKFARFDLSNKNLSELNLNRSNLSFAILRRADLSGAKLILTDLSFTKLIGANLRGANLSGANLSGANLRNVYLDAADLSGTNLREARLIGVDLAKVNLSGSSFENAIFDITNVNVIENNFSEKVNYIRVAIPRPDNKAKYEIVSYKQYKDWLKWKSHRN